MTRDDGSVRSVSWRDVAPWTLLFSVYRVSVAAPVLLLALLGVVVTVVGWQLSDIWCLSDASSQQPEIHRFQQVAQAWPGGARAHDLLSTRIVVREPDGDAMEPDGHPLSGRVSAVYRRLPCYVLTEPFRRIFLIDQPWDQRFYFLVGGFWTLLTWCFLGGAITRIAAVRLGRDERVGVRESLAFAASKLWSYLSAPLLPLLAILALSLPLIVVGWLLRANLGIALSGIGWGVVVLIGLAMALFAIGVSFGWPLMWSTISTEGTDAFDAINRSFAYVYQRPLNFACYVLIALVSGYIGLWIVAIICEGSVYLAHWSTAIGAGSERLQEILGDRETGDNSAAVTRTIGVGLITFFDGVVRSFIVAYQHSYFWVASAAIYLLLRRDADQTEMDDVYLDEESRTVYGLPPMPPNEDGVPGLGRD